MAEATNQVNLTIEELKGFLSHVISNNRHIQASGKNPVAVEIMGDSGLGKTSSVLQLAKELNLNFVKLNLSQIEELGDIIGYPLRQFQLCKVANSPEEKDECLWIDEHAISEYTKNGYSFTGQKRMSYCPPEWIADKQGGGILILDDYNRAQSSMLQACMEICDRQEYISWKLPKDWHVILTCNPSNGDYQVQEMDIAQKTRFISTNLKFDLDCWARWAEKEGIDGRGINFLILHPELVSEKCNPRSIVNFFNSIASFAKYEDNLPMIQLIGEGSVGVEFSSMFTTFILNKLDRLISPKEMLTHDNWKYVKESLESCIGKGGEYRADIASVLATRFVNYSVAHAEKNPVDQKIIDRVITMTTEDVMSSDLKYYMVKGILANAKAKFQKIMLNPSVVKMAVK